MRKLAIGTMITIWLIVIAACSIGVWEDEHGYETTSPIVRIMGELK